MTYHWGATIGEWTAYPSKAPEFTPVFSGVLVTLFLVLCLCFVDRYLSFCPFSFDHCVVCPSLINEFWLSLWYLQTLLLLFVGGPMSYLRYFCLLAYSGVQHILCCDIDLFYFVLCTLCWQFLWIVHFWWLLRYSLQFIVHQYQQSEQSLLTSTNWTVVIFVIGLWWTSNKIVYWSVIMQVHRAH